MRAGVRLFVITLVVALGYSSLGAAQGLAVGPLPDGRLQLFVVSQGQLMTAWKKTPAPDSGWTPFVAFNPAPNGTIIGVTVGRLPDGRLQLFLTGSAGLTTSWKRTTNPDSGWTVWSAPFSTSPQ
jgi:hypothetical protein